MGTILFETLLAIFSYGWFFSIFRTSGQAHLSWGAGGDQMPAPRLRRRFRGEAGAGDEGPLKELENPMNVHRWRKLEGSDPAMYELIQKVRTLQKRLIGKTEEVVAKDVEIQEKERLHRELTQILEKQPGPEVMEQLEVYQENYAAKVKQMKAMHSELRTYQAQVGDYKDEIERITRELSETKSKYFVQKKKEQSGDSKVSALELQADLARFDALLADLRREHEALAQQLRDAAPPRASRAALRAAAGPPAGGEGSRGAAPGVPVPEPREDAAAGKSGDAWDPPSSAKAAWESNHVEPFAPRDPTRASDKLGASGALAEQTVEGGVDKSFHKSFSRSFSKNLQHFQEQITHGSEIFTSPAVTGSEKRHCCLEFVSSPTFELVWSVVILLSTLVMAIEAQYDGMDASYRHDLGRHPAAKPASDVWPGADKAFVVVDTMFGALFTLELVWRLVALRRELFRDAWSWIDISAVVFWYLERLSDAFLPLDPRFIRVTRFVRLLRLVRVIRFVNAFEKLYLMVASITSSFSALAWSAAVLFLLEMVFALLLNIMLEGFWNNTDNPIEDRQAVYQRFGTFSKALLSMFEMLLGNWYSITHELIRVSEWYMIFGVAHQLAFGFAVIEVMTGVFLHETFNVLSLDDSIMANETKRAIQSNTAKMKVFFQNADANGDGFLDKEELEEVLRREKVQEWLSAMGLEINDLVSAFTILDKDKDGQLSTEEFVEGAWHLKGHARAIEVAVLRNLLEEIKAKVEVQGQRQLGHERHPVQLTHSF
ncbi:unnamed protein product [Prorocentrum cordatum]|uniref:EF-hand domain-containing protein n=1 Tax=Prorocentrum cordatum TaxID=2364126 RepID=A0ABN9URP0_9DINO|nr:unnamed protein product [Polarella glacialis]